MSAEDFKKWLTTPTEIRKEQRELLSQVWLEYPFDWEKYDSRTDPNP